jgi:2OG-Fe(II) oxygenase superfamily
LFGCFVLGQVLKPHYDANRDADTEDVNRGGQTLATLIVYLNDVENGGRTRFGKLLSNKSILHSIQNNSDLDESKNDPYLFVTPKRGDALLFFPADKYGKFDERLEHEGCPAGNKSTSIINCDAE